MAVYHEEWPLLVLCPSSARYHWENEFRHWLGEDSTIDSSTDVFDAEKGEGATNEDTEGEEKKDAADGAIPVPKQPMKFLKSSQINVLGSGSDALLPKDTRVVICSYGLAPNLVKNEMIGNGMFQCAIVDESHMLKNKSTQRTKSLLPILKDTKRCILLSGTPALSKPMELWPQLTILGAGKHGWWQDEARFVSKYVRNVSTHRRAELHTLLTGTVMIRRMKNDILKTLPPKVREMARVDVMPDNVRGEMQELMVVLRQGKGKLGEYARQYSANEESTDFMAPPETPAPAGQETQESADQGGQPPVMNQQQLAAAHQQLQQEIQERYNNGIASIQHTIQTTQHQLGQAGIVELMDDMQNRLKQEIEVFQRERMHQIQQQFMLGTPGAVVPSSPVGTDSSARKATLNRMYCLTGEVKVPLIVDMLKRWLDDPTKGKLCIFAHHIAVLDTIAKEAGLSSASDSTRKYIRIDGSTSPRARQECINTFQSDTSVRVALLGITAAGVAVTLTASATVWFAELFWTPALMIQAEDRWYVLSLKTDTFRSAHVYAYRFMFCSY
jgi:SNF2 family DNA or RNA helicase